MSETSQAGVDRGSSAVAGIAAPALLPGFVAQFNTAALSSTS
ncbi:MAG: hypothetical protein AB2705_15895 [Candidatus Thiodiazotropha sp.]